MFTFLVNEVSSISDNAPDQIKVSDYFATIGADNNSVLGVVGKNNQVVQNVDAFALILTKFGKKL